MITILRFRMKRSIYRGWRSLPGDVQAPDVAMPRRAGPDEVGGDEPDLSRLRRAQPVNTLFPRTVDWIISLPPAIRPHLLASDFARIANQLCVSWSDPPACWRYLADLLTDRRGRRQGFRIGVVKELHALRNYYARLHPELAALGPLYL